ncbi:MAG: thiol reductase thioredoxin [Deltaproteobacteria bacterium]|nr:thiol reductase thioredoxin [Deltaproteobacteria bacterium]
MAGGRNVIEITDGNFQKEVLESSTPFLLNLSAEWCGPCKAIHSLVEELATEYTGKLRVGTVDIDHNPQVPTRYQVRSIPTLLLFKGGQVLGQLIGAHPRARIVDLLGKGF